MTSKKQQKATEVAEQEKKELSVPDYGEDAGSGFENQTADDYALPFLGVLQGLSPELETIEGAKPSLLFNTVTGELYGKEVRFVPCTTHHCYVEWIPRDEAGGGGGFVGVHEVASELVQKVRAEQEFGKYKTDEGNDLVETFYVYGILLDEQDNPQHAVIAFSKTKIKAYKQWMTMARSVQVRLGDGRRITPPLFSHVYRVTTAKEKNNKGEYWVLSAHFNGAKAEECRLAPDDELYQDARQLKQMVEAGRARADYKAQDGGEGADDDIPF